MTSAVALSPAEIHARLKDESPKWCLADGCLQRVYATGGWRPSLMIANAIGHLAEVAWHHPDLIVTYPSVTVKLVTHDVGGISDLDFALAAKIEALVAWVPEPPLPGLPAGARFAYLKGDEPQSEG